MTAVLSIRLHWRRLPRTRGTWSPMCGCQRLSKGAHTCKPCSMGGVCTVRMDISVAGSRHGPASALVCPALQLQPARVGMGQTCSRRHGKRCRPRAILLLLSGFVTAVRQLWLRWRPVRLVLRGCGSQTCSIDGSYKAFGSIRGLDQRLCGASNRCYPQSDPRRSWTASCSVLGIRWP